jgi:hypothetical protein
MRALPNRRLLRSRPKRFGRRAMIVMEDCGGLARPRRRNTKSLDGRNDSLPMAVVMPMYDGPIL